MRNKKTPIGMPFVSVTSITSSQLHKVLVRLLGRYCNSETEVKRIRDLCKRAASEQVEHAPARDKQVRRSFTKLKASQCDEILRRYQAGDRPVDIARDFGVTEWTIQNVRKRAAVPTQPHGMNDAAVERAIMLKGVGLSVRKISLEVGHDAKTVAKELRARGIKI